MTVDYVANKQDKVVGAVIKDYFAEKGKNIDEIVKARKADPMAQFKPSLV
jgi:hypothetical protein